MKKQLFPAVLLFASLSMINLGCKKEASPQLQQQEQILQQQDQKLQQQAREGIASLNAAIPPFNLEVKLVGEGNKLGLVKFRQDNDVDKIIALDTWVRGLEANKEYLLQRAVDAINEVDGNCVSTAWLTLGKGLTAQSIITDDSGTGKEGLWRSVAAVASGSAFDIHFRVIDAISQEVVLSSDCYNYVIR